MDTVKPVHVIACGVLAVDLKAIVDRLGLDVSMEFLPGGLHTNPSELRERLQRAIDVASSSHRGDVIAVGYGVCGLGTVGVHARNIPLAIPRVHDCIALLLGSDAAYKEQFARYPGTYYISAGWVEERAQPQAMRDDEPSGGQPESLQCGTTSLDFGQLVAKHGRENAEAIRHFLSSWQRNYQRAAFIDTGVPGRRRRYATIAQAMADEFGWSYEELSGTGELLTRLLRSQRSTDEILMVPPHHVTAYDPVGKGLMAVPVWESTVARADHTHTLVFEGSDETTASPEDERSVRFGLGIDAGGTYTDAVLYDFPGDRVVAKAKALTTKADLAVGIEQALDQLDADRVAAVDLVAVSTTLATNAIVEGDGQRVGLLIMPPYGRFEPSDIAHRPIATLDGRLEIDGTEIAPIDPEQVRRIAREMVQRNGVRAFAVAGFAGHNNPSHELRAKAIIREETGLTVTCGHEVSDRLDYRTRAETAALNARIIPCLNTLLEKVHVSLGRRGIAAPLMVVKSDGSLMSVQTARDRPIETILSGPAASVAGASYLMKASDAFVVDVGGTTTDTAVIKDGAVRTCEQGASVGGWRTHVRALDMRTLGLGGDSLIAYEKRMLQIGPRRVAPVSWLVSHRTDAAGAIDWIERRVDQFDASTRPMELIVLNGREHHDPLTEEEDRILDALSHRPHSVHELAERVGCIAWQLLSLRRLEDTHTVQRCALTPTDLLHATGQLNLWDTAAARRTCKLFCRLMNANPDAFARETLREVVRRLAVELLKKQLDKETDADDLDSSPAAKALVGNLLDGGTEAYRVRVSLHRPVIGIGAPAHVFLPEAARLLETEAIIPPNADVANAIGAITSSVRIRKQVKITPNELGTYSVYGLPDTPAFVDFDEAHRFAIEALQRSLRRLARQAGTSQTRVEIVVDDRIAPLADGGRIFVGRTLEAHLTGSPDLTRRDAAC